MKKLKKNDMKAVKGGGSLATFWQCLYTLGRKFGSIYYECSIADPSGPNYYCTKVGTCVL